MNEKLGKAAISFAIVYLRRRYRRQLRIGVGIVVGTSAVAVAAYLTRRNVPEG